MMLLERNGEKENKKKRNKNTFLLNIPKDSSHNKQDNTSLSSIQTGGARGWPLVFHVCRRGGGGA
jgi:hypothetical protein